MPARSLTLAYSLDILSLLILNTYFSATTVAINILIHSHGHRRGVAVPER